MRQSSARSPMHRLPTLPAILAAAGCVVLASHAQAEATWIPTASGTYTWTDTANWTAPVPSAPGAVANITPRLAGDQTITLDQPVTLGTLNIGDPAGKSSGGVRLTGSGPLTLQSSTAGGPTTINNLSSGGRWLLIDAPLVLGGASPLELNLKGAAGYHASLPSLNTGKSTLTVKTANAGITLGLGTVTGSGTIVLNAAGLTPVTGGAGGIALGDETNLKGYTGSITVNNGRLSLVKTPLSSLSTITVAGAFQQNDKYPQGGMVFIGHDSVQLSTIPDRLPHNGTLVLSGGGYFDHEGTALVPALAGQPVIEQVKTIQFNPGISEIRLRWGPNNPTGAKSITLLANDPKSALVRAQGATFMAGGDDGGRDGQSLGVSEFLKFSSGATAQLKGGGGPAGSNNQSIIPWMVVGTIYHPATGGFATYDANRGIHSIPPSDYYTGRALGAPADANLHGADLNLGANHTQTINSFWGATAATEIGPGSTLTITSGAILFNGGGKGFTPSIGNGNPASAGTLNFGPAEGIIFTEWAGCGGILTIGSRITGTAGLTVSGTSTIVLKAANAYTGQTTVGGGILQIGDGATATSKLGQGDLLVCAGATVRLKPGLADAIANTATVSLQNVGDTFYGTMDLEAGVNETIANLTLGGIPQPAGTYGSTASPATHKLDQYFTGPGILTVTKK